MSAVDPLRAQGHPIGDVYLSRQASMGALFLGVYLANKSIRSRCPWAEYRYRTSEA